MYTITRAWLFAAMTFLSSSAFGASCGGFTDVDDSLYPGDLCSGTDWMKNRKVTLGCGANLYCPDLNVSRIQMAAFMKRLGEALTSKKLFVDLNPGPVTIQNDAYQFVCLSAPHTPPHEQSANVHGLAWGVVNAPVTWSADIWYSVDGAASFHWATDFIPAFAAPSAGMTSGSTFARVDLNPGQTYIFAILIRESPDANNGTGNFADLGCHMLVDINNRNPSPPAPPPCDFSPSIPGCNDARPGGSLGRNGGR
jgi:hypothetical protein